MDIAFAFAESCVGRCLEVLVEGKRGRRYYGRSYMDAPDIDTRVYFTSEEALAPGDFVWVDITGAQEYDLTGKARNKGETP